mmetsp:Transcript_19309/g.50367  ORF Transcript_19309/g.50367 Transcript_19309/m.50367 type:complete len:293 (-) Transcript_19309:506-1384(-)
MQRLHAALAPGGSRRYDELLCAPLSRRLRHSVPPEVFLRGFGHLGVEGGHEPALHLLRLHQHLHGGARLLAHYHKAAVCLAGSAPALHKGNPREDRVEADHAVGRGDVNALLRDHRGNQHVDPRLSRREGLHVGLRCCRREAEGRGWWRGRHRVQRDRSQTADVGVCVDEVGEDVGGCLLLHKDDPFEPLLLGCIPLLGQDTHQVVKPWEHVMALEEAGYLGREGCGLGTAAEVILFRFVASHHPQVHHRQLESVPILPGHHHHAEGLIPVLEEAAGGVPASGALVPGNSVS